MTLNASGGTVTRLLARTALLAVVATGARFSSVRAQTTSRLPVVTLEEARRRAAVVDPTTITARAEAGAAGWERRAAWLDLVTPTVTAGAGYTHFSDPFFNFGTGGISPNATSATLQAGYTVLGASKLAALKSSGASVASAEASETVANFRSAFATDAAYYAVLQDREFSGVAAERLRRATEQFSIARARVMAGEAIATDSLQLQLEMNRAQVEVLRRDSALRVSQLGLGRRVGVNGPVEAAADSSPALPLPLSLEAAVGEMRQGGPELIAARAAERHADAQLDAARQS
jgi:outer membrane protein TolC